MPNLCSNHLTVSGDSEQLSDFITKTSIIKEGERHFTFQGIIPRHPDLDITSGSSTDTAVDIIHAQEGDWSGIDIKLTWEKWVEEAKILEEDPPLVKRDKMLLYMISKSTPEEMEEGRKSINNIKVHGAKDWYDWNLVNWGTKWDANSSYYNDNPDDDFYVDFETAWSPPIPVIAKAEELWPKLTFVLDFEEEGMQFKGTYSNGVDTDLSDQLTSYDDEDNELKTETA